MGPTIVLVEDHEEVRQTLVDFYTELGYEVVSVGSAEEAIEAIFKVGACLLVADILLPGRCGFELAELACELRPDIKVLLITALAEDEIESLPSFDCEKAILFKPLRPDSLRKVTEQLTKGCSGIS